MSWINSKEKKWMKLVCFFQYILFTQNMNTNTVRSGIQYMKTNTETFAVFIYRQNLYSICKFSRKLYIFAVLWKLTNSRICITTTVAVVDNKMNKKPIKTILAKCYNLKTDAVRTAKKLFKKKNMEICFSILLFNYFELLSIFYYTIFCEHIARMCQTLHTFFLLIYRYVRRRQRHTFNQNEKSCTCNTN